jgi:hypothetical protein
MTCRRPVLLVAKRNSSRCWSTFAHVPPKTFVRLARSRWRELGLIHESGKQALKPEQNLLDRKLGASRGEFLGEKIFTR